MDTHAKIREYIAKNLLFSDNGFAYDDDDSFLEEGIVDSLGIMELVMFVEETFGVTIEDHEIIPDNFDSVNKLTNYVHSKQAVVA